MQEILFADGADLAVAEKAREADGAELILDTFGVVVGAAKEALAAAVATAQAPAINRRAFELFHGATEQFVHVFHRGGGGAALKLHGLARARESAHGNRPRFGIGAQEIAHEKIERAVMEIFSFKPANIVKQLNLLRPIYSKTTNYGHFGKVSDLDAITWERTDKADALKKAVS